MTPALHRVGAVQAPVVIVDDFTGDVPAIVDIAAALAPFPRAGNAYPGVRRLIGAADEAASAYVRRTLQAAAPFIGGGFHAERFDLVEASFSMVVDPPGALAPPQRTPAFRLGRSRLSGAAPLSERHFRDRLLPPARDPDRAGRCGECAALRRGRADRERDADRVHRPPPTCSSIRSAWSRVAATGW